MSLILTPTISALLVVLFETLVLKNVFQKVISLSFVNCNNVLQASIYYFNETEIQELGGLPLYVKQCAGHFINVLSCFV